MLSLYSVLYISFRWGCCKEWSHGKTESGAVGGACYYNVPFEIVTAFIVCATCNEEMGVFQLSYFSMTTEEGEWGRGGVPTVNSTAKIQYSSTIVLLKNTYEG